MRKIKNKLLINGKHLRHSIKLTNMPKRVVHKNVPYFSQWESRELNKQILDKKIDAKDDPKWKSSGAATRDEYISWSWSGCGMACLKMVLAYKLHKAVPLVQLGKKCVEYGGYVMPLEKTKGLLYAPFITFVAQEFGLKAKVMAPMIQREIINELAKGNYIIASVNSDIRQPASHPRTKGGHLILMLGYDLSKKELYFHNPSGDTNKTQEYAAVTFGDFKKFFSNRGIVIEA